MNGLLTVVEAIWLPKHQLLSVGYIVGVCMHKGIRETQSALGAC